MLDQKKNQAFVRSMMQALDRKRAQAEEAKAAERRYNDECIKVSCDGIGELRQYKTALIL